MPLEFCRKLEEIGFRLSEKIKDDSPFPGLEPRAYRRIAVHDKLKALALYLHLDIQDVEEIVHVKPLKDFTFEVTYLRTGQDEQLAPIYVVPEEFIIGNFRSYDEPLDNGARAIKATLF